MTSLFNESQPPRLSSPVDLHVHLLLQLHLVLLAEVVEPSIGVAQVALDEVQLRGDETSERRHKKAREPRTGRGSACRTHLLGLGRVGLSVHFEEGELLTAVVVHPFTEVVADVESPVKSEREAGDAFTLIQTEIWLRVARTFEWSGIYFPYVT